METGGNQASNREAVGVFMDKGNLKKAIKELLESGFGCDDLGLVASEFAVQQGLGDLYIRMNEPYDPNHVPEAAFVKKEAAEDTVHGLAGGLYFAGGTAAMGALVASAALIGGPLIVALTAVAAVGAVGALVGGVISKSDADYLREQVDQGHVLLCVRNLGDPAREAKAREILSRHAALEVKAYDLPVKVG